MAVIDIRQRAGFLLLVVTLGHVILISAQLQSKVGVPVLELLAFTVFSEIQRGASTVVGGTARTWRAYVDLRHVQAENQVLKRQLETALIEGQGERALADRTRSLEQLLTLRASLDLQTTAAGIIAAGVTPDFRTVTIDKGKMDGLKADMAVLAPAGVVGRVVVPSPRAAKVQLLTDRNAAAGALIERSRAQGVVVGTGDGRLEMQFVSEVADVAAGDLVVTSGIDGIFPKGLIVGAIQAVEKSGTAYRRIAVRPAVDFGTLEDVLVVLSPTHAREALEEPQP
jgi:rod shape-determining protein MreC